MISYATSACESYDDQPLLQRVSNAAFRDEPDVKLQLISHHGRIKLTACRFGKSFDIFEDYPTSYPSQEHFSAAAVAAAKEKAPNILNYFGS